MNSFTSFYETWFEQLHHLVYQLSTCPIPPTNPDQHHHLLVVVQKVMAHYAEYYSVKSLAAERDTVSVFVAPWATTLERSLYWIGGLAPHPLQKKKSFGYKTKGTIKNFVSV
ncbi:transcription factor TGA2.1-like [Pyrus communis]|uniref:transcription factor TGA2.1-like n=1 Tax=Pyrus communis TaxID=23211 RepID=UPI0035C00015